MHSPEPGIGSAIDVSDAEASPSEDRPALLGWDLCCELYMTQGWMQG